MPTGQYTGYTGDTLIHLADGKHKYMWDLAVGDLVNAQEDCYNCTRVANKIVFQFDGFITLVAPGISTTRYTKVYDDTTAKALDIKQKPTIYYKGPMYNFTTTADHGPIMAGNAADMYWIYPLNKHNPLDKPQLNALAESPCGTLLDVWCDPPGVVTKRIGHAERMAALAAL